MIRLLDGLETTWDCAAAWHFSISHLDLYSAGVVELARGLEKIAGLGFPDERKGRKASGADDIELNANRSVWLAKGELSLSFAAGRQVRQRDFLLFQRNASLIVSNGPQVIPAKGVRRDVVACLHQDTK